jgi:hypothetical protein
MYSGDSLQKNRKSRSKLGICGLLIFERVPRPLNGEETIFSKDGTRRTRESQARE